MVAAVKRVLVVDDEEIVRESYKLALTDAGYEVRTVPNGREAISACRAEHFDVMLADIRMPDMDGLEVSQVVVHEFPEVRVIVITGYPSSESAARAKRLGVSDYLQKPVAPDRLSAATAAALARPVDRAPAGSMHPRRQPCRRLSSLRQSPAASAVPVEQPAVSIPVARLPRPCRSRARLDEGHQRGHGFLCAAQLAADWTRVLPAVSDRRHRHCA